MRSKHRHVIALAGAALILMATAPAQAGEDRFGSGNEAFSQAVSPQELTQFRAGDLSVQGNENLTQYAQSDQRTNGASQDNSITADSIPSGHISLNGETMSNVRGINNVVINSAAQAVVQGTVSLTVIANN